MSVEAINLHFLSGLHIGRGSEELDKTATTYSSDALKSALFAIGLPYYPEWSSNEKQFFEGFRISSAFPFCGKDYFLPKPGGMTFKFTNANDLTEAKQAKKINFVSTTVFASWLKNPEGSIQVDEKKVGDGSFLFGHENGQKFMHTAIQQRVTVSAEGEDAVPYYFERLLFTENSGLYFLIEFVNESLRPQILHALRLLGDTGIGTDRTVGNGQFTFSVNPSFILPTGNTKGLQMALGLFLPSKEELAHCNLDESSWSLIRRGGYLAASRNESFRSLRKNNIYFFGEGSSFKTDVPLKGRYVDLKPDFNNPELHPVWRCGMPMFINL